MTTDVFPQQPVLTAEQALHQAVAYHQAGQLQDAERLYRAILQAQPTHPDANHNLGVLAVQVKQPVVGLPHFKVALEANPDQGQYWLSYIEALVQAGQMAVARQVLEQGRQRGLQGEAVEALAGRLEEGARVVGPSNGEYQVTFKEAQLVAAAIPKKNPKPNKAARKSTLRKVKNPTPQEINALVALFSERRYTEAEALARSMTARFPLHGFGWKVLGALLNQKGRSADALAPMQKATELSPNDAEAHGNLGVALKELGRLDDAVASYRRALEIKPDFAEAHSNLGNALQGLGRFDDAMASCRRALEIKPDYAQAHSNLGNALQGLWRFDDAMASYRRALEIKPDYAEAHSKLGVALYGHVCFDQHLARYRRAQVIDPVYAECYRNFGLQKKYTLDDPRIPVLRRLYQTTRKETDRGHVCFALAKVCEDLKEYDEAFSFYAEGNNLRKKELGYHIDLDRRLFDRIKSTFDRLPMVFPEPLRAMTPILVVGMPRSGTTLAEQILASHSNVFGAGELTMLGSLVQKHFLGMSASNFDLTGASRQITSSYLEALNSIGEGHRFVTDKMPLNFRWLGFLMLIQPDIKIVHTIRDPMAVCWSSFKHYFPVRGLGFAYDLADLAEYYRLYEDMMQFWRERFPGRIYALNYERLTENQEEETRKLLAYCGLEWEDRCLEFEKTKRVVKTASAVQVRNKMYKGSSEAWRKFEGHLGPLLEGLGLARPSSPENSS